ncbi:hypothetical protein [Pseudomonas fluorescens]|uniref:hypothetical protein n=1 Tax=Pseudomonas fluorescens TaxID=294 RepID=UPI0012423385|nr:hypothetical protein [Pseudomonas fluorescens]
MSFVLINLFLVLASLLVGLIGVGVSCYIGYRDLDVVLNIFKNSYAVTYYGRMPPGKWSFATRLSLASNLSGIIAWSSRYIQSGMLDPEELARLPASIKTRMKWSSGLTTGGFLGWCVVCVVFVVFK